MRCQCRELSINRWPAGDNMFQLSENLDCSTNSDDIQYPIWMQCWNVADSFWEHPFELTSTKNIGHTRRCIWCYMCIAGSTPVSFIRNTVVVAMYYQRGIRPHHNTWWLMYLECFPTSVRSQCSPKRLVWDEVLSDFQTFPAPPDVLKWYIALENIV